MYHNLDFPFTKIKTIYIRNSFKNNTQFINYIKMNQTVFDSFTVYGIAIDQILEQQQKETIKK